MSVGKVIMTLVSLGAIEMSLTVNQDSSGMPYQVGVGIADMTGPSTEITFMGYAELGQTGLGIHLRQFARCFIFIQGDTRFVLISAELQSVGLAVRREVVKRLQKVYGDMYTLRNVIMAGTHTHSTPGGYLVDFILDISILGFSTESFNAYVEGIYRSIVRAHENVVPARLLFSQISVSNTQRNRSPYSYTFDPSEEKSRYDSNVDNTLTQIRIENSDGILHGLVHWFAVHRTSMNLTNRLVSSDNLGYSALLMEQNLNPGLPTGKPKIVSGFFTANLGDVSPNTRDPRCEFSGAECDNQFLLCEAGERCYSLGPGGDMFESTRIIGTTVYEAALAAMKQPSEELTGTLAIIHQFVEMPVQVVSKYDPVSRTFDASIQVKGCVAALGNSFPAGTTDGANILPFKQGTTVGNPLLNLITGVAIASPTTEDIKCHAPKPILLATGRANYPVPWHPRIVSVSLMKLGGLMIAGVPGEPTTMAGRRIRDVISNATGLHTSKIMINGLNNEYIQYVTTFEEYQVQRYEGASTIYGPYTLNILLSKFAEFAPLALQGGDVAPGPIPQDYRNRTLSLILPVILDGTPLLKTFGEVLEQPPTKVRRGDVASAVFQGASPRNDLKQENTFLSVERQESGEWIQVASDADWETRFIWERQSTVLGTSKVTIEYHVPSTAVLGEYRIRYIGTSKHLGVTGEKLTDFEGMSDQFQIVA